MKKDTKGLLWGALVGSVVGSVTALLFAPKPGKELRKDIAEGTAAGIDKAQEIAVQVGDKSIELYDKAKDSITHVVHEVQEWGKSCSNIAEDDKATVAVSGIATEETIEEAAATLEVVSESVEASEIDEVSSEEASLEDDVQETQDKNEIV